MLKLLDKKSHIIIMMMNAYVVKHIHFGIIHGTDIKLFDERELRLLHLINDQWRASTKPVNLLNPREIKLYMHSNLCNWVEWSVATLETNFTQIAKSTQISPIKI